MKKLHPRQSSSAKKRFPLILVLLFLLPGCQLQSEPEDLPEEMVTVYLLTGYERPSENVTWTYGENGNLLEWERIYGQEGQQRAREVYDEEGRLVLEETSDGQTIYTYDEYGNNVSDDAEYVYDDQGNILSCTVKVNGGLETNTFRYTYDEDGRKTSVWFYEDNNTTASSGTEYDYNSEGNLLEERNYQGENLYRWGRYTYDEEGRMLTEEVGVADYYESRTVYTYDENGNKIQCTVYRQEDGKSTTFTQTWDYDQNGNMLKHVEIDGFGEASLLVCTYDKDNHKLTEYYKTSYTTRYCEWTYDKAGRLESEQIYTDRAFQNTTYTYDDAGNMVTKVEAFESERITEEYTHQWTYDEAGNALSHTVVLPEGEITVYYTYTSVVLPADIAEEAQRKQDEIWSYLTAGSVNG